MTRSRTVYHPTLDNVSSTVAADQVARWRKAGWRLKKPAPSLNSSTAPVVDPASTDQGDNS